MEVGRRQLKAIMFTDIVGYSAVVYRDEALALELLQEHREILRPLFAEHGGREVNTMGDAFLVEFSSALDAVLCALAIQRCLQERNQHETAERLIRLRIGVHLGDVVHQNGDVYGDGVNIASRIERLAGRGGVCVSRQVYDQVRGRVGAYFISLGSQELRNIPSPVEVYRVEPSEGRAPEEEAPHPFDVSRVAVLPLVNLSSSAGDEFFADGMTGELIYTLSRIPGLKVIAQTSVMKYKGARASVAEIARELRVGTVLEGSVRKAGEQVRITLQLIDVASEGLLWSEAYDREVRDVFAVQSDVARRVADALQVRFQAAERRRLSRQPPENVQAYMRYLQGRSFWNMRTERAVGKAIECFEEAIAMDPQFALAHAGIADCYVVMADWGYMIQAEGFRRAREAALKALELDDTLAEPHASLAITVAGLEGQYPRAKAEMELALELNPNYATGRHWYATLLLRMGDLQGALDEGSRAVELDPLSPVIATEYGEMLAMAGRFTEAEEQFHRTLDLNPGFTGARCSLAKVLQQTWRWERAEEVLRRAVELDPGFARARADLGMLLLITGRAGQGIAELREAVRLAPDNPAVSHALALALLFTGAIAEALQQAEQTVEENPSFEPGLIGLALAHAAGGNFQEALTEIRKADELVQRGYRLLDEDTVLGQALVFSWMGRSEEVRGLLGRVSALDEGPNRMFVTAMINFLLGELEEGFASLERSLQRREASLRLLGLLPLPDGVRGDSRYRAAMVRIGLAD